MKSDPPTYDDFIDLYQITLLQKIADELEIEYDPLPWQDE